MRHVAGAMFHAFFHQPENVSSDNDLRVKSADFSRETMAGSVDTLSGGLETSIGLHQICICARIEACLHRCKTRLAMAFSEQPIPIEPPPAFNGVGLRAVSLSEAARRFADLGRGPSRATLSRDATAGNLTHCRNPGTSRSARYDFTALRAHYGVDTDRPAQGRTGHGSSASAAGHAMGAFAQQLDRIANELASLRTADPAATRQPTASAEGLGEVHTRLDRMGAELEQLRTMVGEVTRNTRDILEMRRMLMLKYDAEAGLLRQRAESAEQRLRQAPAVDSLSREVSSVRQAVARLATLIEDRIPPAS